LGHTPIYYYLSLELKLGSESAHFLNDLNARVKISLEIAYFFISASVRKGLLGDLLAFFARPFTTFEFFACFAKVGNSSG